MGSAFHGDFTEHSIIQYPALFYMNGTATLLAFMPPYWIAQHSRIGLVPRICSLSAFLFVAYRIKPSNGDKVHTISLQNVHVS